MCVKSTKEVTFNRYFDKKKPKPLGRPFISIIFKFLWVFSA